MNSSKLVVIWKMIYNLKIIVKMSWTLSLRSICLCLQDKILLVQILEIWRCRETVYWITFLMNSDLKKFEAGYFMFAAGYVLYMVEHYYMHLFPIFIGCWMWIYSFLFFFGTNFKKCRVGFTRALSTCKVDWVSKATASWVSTGKSKWNTLR